MTTTTTLAHFSARFPTFALEEDERVDLASMPLDSTCGDDCRAAIDAAGLLVDAHRKAFGDDRPETEEAIVRASLDAALCYICG